ncbi:alkaline phosphatase family protein [Nocardioides daeguensis]|uniref:Phospholipase C, phosphocholine-specific n=1 Tax=Nocardioides daeguensis TaxID=908359 RepID=A0ABP6USG5_9ACTN|nr:alkaline phosphatase family protein [Nocardioides daeguensis]MBV6728694.1 DUF756 domain-containing protein [Nocardioides daeguensis]MCR1773697.1 DUF756 domain-containing protein [Nocardioides daeguensis]
MASEPTPFDAEPYDRDRVVPDEILHSGLSRRGMLRAMGLLGGAAAVAGGGAAAWAGPDGTAAGVQYVLPEGFSGDMDDLRHVVILIQENRSFDHYYGAFPGVRGLHDKQALAYPNGTTVFDQPQGSGVRRPTRVTTVAGMSTGLPHGWSDGQAAWAEGRNNGWVAAKGADCMNYMTGEELPYQYALASEFTICDQNHCSTPTSTTPNRLYHMSGTSSFEVNNGNESTGSRAWQTYPEALQAAGVSWRIYVDNSNNGSSWVGDYTDNPIRGFANISPSGTNLLDAEKNRPGTGLMWRAGSEPYLLHGLPNNDSEQNLNGVLKDFIDACRPGAEFPLPEVSWIVAPYAWSEHPAANPEHGAHFTNRVLETLQANPEIWKHTLFVMTFDENDGYFDHVLPPRPEPGTPGEFKDGKAMGYGARVPMILVSPWTRGGWVSSEVFDHTSILRFLEVWTEHLGKPARCANITAWRRAISGDLTSAIDFAHPVVAPVDLPDTAALKYIAATLPNAPFAGQVAPEDEWVPANQIKHRPLSFHPHGTFVEDRADGTVAARLVLEGGPDGKAVSLQAFPDAHLPFANTPYTVSKTNSRSHLWDVKATDGRYAFTVYGPDGFVRSHAGTLLPAGQNSAGVPRADVALIRGANAKVEITLRNDGRRAVSFTLAANDHVGGRQTLSVGPGATKVVSWPTSEGYYDVVITASTGTGWKHRYAGRIATA